MIRTSYQDNFNEYYTYTCKCFITLPILIAISKSLKSLSHMVSFMKSSDKVSANGIIEIVAEKCVMRSGQNGRQTLLLKFILLKVVQTQQ